METKIKVMAEDVVELDEIGNLQKYLGKLNKTLAAANIREDRDSRVAELKWLYQIEMDESEKQKLVIKIKSIISSEIKVDTDSDDEQVVKIVRRQNTPQSAIALDILPSSFPSPILEDWNSDNESYSHLVIDNENFNESSVLFNRYISESEHISSARTLETEQISESPDNVNFTKTRIEDFCFRFYPHYKDAFYGQRTRIPAHEYFDFSFSFFVAHKEWP